MMRRQNHHHHNHEQHQGQEREALYELSSLILNILRGPPTSSSSLTTMTMTRRRRQITPAEFASLMLGISLTLMLGGSLTFMLGFMLFPWVVAFVMLFYFVGLLSCLSLLGRTLLCYAIPPPLSPPPSTKDFSAWRFL